ncbi:hypothetical protein RvY_13257 [Ramazzottius varieornatus]|uniref:Uncharacterized protein n=1 Tax=Ramazzottius varieornatus TaxID=947166 RepID=A0A1D1VSM7_RAMVA|nr:hypothetical protein RvY_13257 [Ramazzottius varieornatus]
MITAALTWELAYQSVFLVTFPQDNSSNGRLPNPFVTAPYEDVILFGHVLEETLNDPSRVVDLNDGSAFARRYWNRTFWLDTGPIEFDEVGERKQPLIIQQFQKGGVWPTTIMTLDASANEFVDVASISWVAPFPPPNEPPCGFLGTNAICWKKGENEGLSQHPYYALPEKAITIAGQIVQESTLKFSDPKGTRELLIKSSITDIQQHDSEVHSVV